MNSLFNKNVSALEGKNPELFHRISGVTPSGRYHAVPTKSGHHTILCLPPGRSPEFLHSPDDPVQEAVRLAAEQKFRGEDITVLLGCGLAYLPLAIADRMHPEHRLIIIESDLELLSLAMHTRDLSGLITDNRIYLLHTESHHQITDALDKEQFHILGGCVRKLIFPPAYSLHPRLYLAAEKKIEAWTRLVRDNYRGLDTHSEWTIHNIFGNIPQLSGTAPINALEGIFSGTPALVVAAGPSLDKNLTAMAAAQGRFLIISVDTAVKPLLSSGIRPDVIISVDPIEANGKKFQKIPVDALRDIPLVYSPYVLPGILPLFQGPKFIFNEHNLMSQWALAAWFPVMTLPYGFSVTHYAFYVARLLGTTPIIFTGLDLAYTGNRDHAESCADVWHMDQSRKDFPMVPDVFGNRVKSDTVFIHMISLFEKEIAKTRTLCIDATEGGAYVPGTRIVPLQEAVDRYGDSAKPDCFGILEDAWAKSKPESDRALLRALKWLEEEAGHVNRLCTEALPLIDDLRNRIDAASIGLADLESGIVKINRISDRIGTHDGFKAIVKDRLAKVLVNQFQARFRMERATDDLKRTAIGIEQSHLFFTEMDKTSGYIHHRVKPVLRKLEQRLSSQPS